MPSAPPVAALPVQPGRRPAPLPQGLVFAGTATAFMSLYLAAGAPTPLLTFYQHHWNAAPPLLTLAFGVYAGGFLVALLTAGSLSDHVGRRPVLLGSLVVQLASMAMFLAAGGIETLIAARAVQGLATGAATSAFSAALVEVAPANRKKLGTVLGSVGVASGLSMGALLAGLAMEYTPRPDIPVFTGLAAVTLFGMVIVALTPESGVRRSGALRSLMPRVTVPAPARREFAGAAPAIAAGWMLAALSLGLAPSLVRIVFEIDSGLVTGFSVFVGPAAAAVAGIAFLGVGARKGMVLGLTASLLGTAGILAGILAENAGVMFSGQAVGGIGFGAAFAAALRLTVPLVDSGDRGGLVAAVYILAYAAFSIPVIVVGQVAPFLGLVPAVLTYAAVAAILGIVGLIKQLGLQAASAAGTYAPEGLHE